MSLKEEDNSSNNSVERLIETFNLFDNWEDKYSYLIDLGKKCPVMADEFKSDFTKVDGCISRVWIYLYIEDGFVKFNCDSDAFIVKGLLGVLNKIYYKKKPKEILEIDIKDIFKKLMFDSHLSPGRRNGLFSAIEKIRNFAKNNI